VNAILVAAALPPERRNVPFPVAYLAGAAVEAAWRLARRSGEPPLTRFLARQLSTAHWFDLTAARRDLGYRPLVTTAVGLTRLASALQRP
jgi:nucleoside-diphosphate-sugar epimerase